MRLLTSAALAIISLGTVLLTGCTKNNDANDSMTSNPTLRRYGLNAMQPSDWANVPIYRAGAADRIGSTSEVLPASCLLATPSVRDQGQIGSCTGFCGTEANEIIRYYNSGSATPLTGINSSNGASTAASTHFSSTLLSPLFLYYVERCVINNQTISTDKGANMVNICQALQGLTSNTNTGTALSLNGSTFKGQSTESSYAYPNPATATSSQFLTAPGNAAIAEAPSYSIGLQSGLTSSSNNTSNSTTSGYFVIGSTGSTLIADVKDAIFNKKPVMMGFNVYDNELYSYFEGLNTASYTYNPLTSNGRLASGVRLLGGHAVPIVGYIDDASKPGGGVVVVQNSWGTGWGYQGYFYMPYSVLTSTKIVPSVSLYVAL